MGLKRIPFNLKNRHVMAPMTRCLSKSCGSPTKPLAKYYISRSRKDLGLIIVESCAVNATDSLGYKYGCQLNNLKHAEAWAPIIEEIHKNGTKIWVQLFHPGRLTVPEICNCTPIAPTALKPLEQPSFWRPKLNNEIVHFQSRTPFVRPKEMTLQEIDKVINDFKNSCILAEIAGFDGIELHGAHGYLIHQFCNKISNARNDDYGFNGNFIFSSRLVELCKSNISKSMILSYRISKHFIDHYYLSIAEMCLDRLIPKLDNLGIDVFHSSELKVGEINDRSGLTLGQKIRKYTNKPIIGCGGLHSVEHANSIMQKHSCYDLMAFGRSLIVKNRIPIKSMKPPTFCYEELFNLNKY